MNEPLYNLSYLQEIAQDDPELQDQLIDIFIAQIPEFISNMKKFYAENDMKLLGKEAHTAKSSILVFGMVKTSEILKKIQIYADNNTRDNVFELILEAEKDLTLVLEDLLKNRP